MGKMEEDMIPRDEFNFLLRGRGGEGRRLGMG